MTAEQMDERARREGMTFVSLGHNGTRTYSRPHVDGYRTTYLVLSPDGKEQFFKAEPISTMYPASLTGDNILAHPVDRGQPRPTQNSSLVGLSAWEKVKSWLTILFIYIPLSLASIAGGAYGLNITYHDWRTVSQGSYVELWVTPTKYVSRRSSRTYYGKILLPNGRTVEAEMDDSDSRTVTGWHLNETFVRDKNAQSWIWQAIVYGTFFFFGLYILASCFIGLRDLVCA